MTTSVLVNVHGVDVLILVPVFNDWLCVEEVILRLDRAFASSSDSVAVMLVDDGSATEPPKELGLGAYAKLGGISVLKLKKNLGHQRALAVGLCYIAEKIRCDFTLVMDGDGEDKPDDAVRLLEKVKELPRPAIVFAERTRRSESPTFRFGYAIYRILHYVLTGRGIRVGNFSIIPAVYVQMLTVEPLLWNHYAASVIHMGLPVAGIPTERGERIQGRSRLNFVALVVHGLSALACYAEIIGVRLIVVSGVLSLLALLSLAALVGLKLFTAAVVPGWTPLLLCLIVVVALQVTTIVSNFTMQIISGRSVQPFLPARDYAWFVLNYRILYGKAP